MKTLERQFVANHEKTGNHTFFQLQRTDKVALYKRITEDGKLFGYEVFRIKTRLKGQALPGGGVEAEDREVYPKANAFGNNALFIAGPNAEDEAKKIFDEWTKTAPEPVEDEEDSDEPEKMPDLHMLKNRIGKWGTTTPTTDYIIPDGEFTNVQFAEANGLPPVGKGYMVLKSLVTSGKVKEVARRKVTEGRGRATVFYSRV